jgi:hypothetical protein
MVIVQGLPIDLTHHVLKRLGLSHIPLVRHAYMPNSSVEHFFEDDVHSTTYKPSFYSWNKLRILQIRYEWYDMILSGHSATCMTYSMRQTGLGKVDVHMSRR